ncbi:MAG: hypothetical protein U9P38_06705 [Campylobacterota bacterium]|nr:hypothetical protein [Campylobacterota bacterium]
MKFNKKLKTIFLDSHSKEFKIKGKVNIVLSPTLYWVKKLSLPVKYLRDAKKLLPSIFEDSLPQGNYSYMVYKSGDDFIAFAYEDKLILDTLAKKGIKNSNIANIYFAQSELVTLQTAYKIDKSHTLCVKDDIVLLLPSVLFEKTQYLDMSSIKHSKHSVTLTQFGHIVDKKSLYKIMALVIAFIVMIGIELFITQQKVAEITLAKEGLFSNYKLKPTMFQNRAMLKKYNTIHKKQMKIREYSGAILGLRLQSENRLVNLTLKEKVLVASFSGLVKGKESYIKQSLKKRKIAFKSSFKNKIFKVEIAL